MTEKHPEWIVRQRSPLNGGPPPHLIARQPVTPIELFFVRNHAPAPAIEPDAYRLRVEGLVERPRDLSLAELKELPAVTLEATLQCAGNRRDQLMALEHIPGEVGWGSEAISHGVWRGVPLRAVLARAGVRASARHVAFEGLDEIEQGGAAFGLGGSVPLEKGLAGDVLLAYELNGAPLPAEHGFPLRAVVPGYIGARSVKWLGKIRLQREPSDNYYQAHAYKLFPPDVRAETADWARGLMLSELSLNAAVCAPEPGARLKAGRNRIMGYAAAGGNRTVERVDVSADGGRAWVEAELSARKPWSWRLWSVALDLPPGEHELVARAWDSAANTQPELPVWNFKGYMNHAWHRVPVTVVR